ncbi:hypothetical protein KVR01_013291 [Diaporthe batatas]|uniref:uncharacterized protein n=1 Tax=Diaporthe batatas TaxID=748121 RepID=UPI001D037D3C|nr:uncharacterized protein KVR01_013291 [Diaporthe batatas]KAG8156878.1 hypothetical protein KVR01_013291 [Diaporthe batatas]
MLIRPNMFFQLSAVLALLLLLLPGTTATVTEAPPECDGLGKSWSQIGSSDTITAGAIDLCSGLNSPDGCDHGCTKKFGSFDVNDKYSVRITYRFDREVHNITLPCMEHFNQTREICDKGGRIDFMVHDNAAVNSTRIHGNFTAYPYPNKC